MRSNEGKNANEMPLTCNGRWYCTLDKPKKGDKGICNQCGLPRKHGGVRKGSGRKKKEPTKLMRIPISKVQAVKNLIGK
jgi:hypothetical protein